MTEENANHTKNTSKKRIKKKATKKKVIQKKEPVKQSEEFYSMEKMVEFFNLAINLDVNLFTNLFSITCICSFKFLDSNMVRRAAINNQLLCSKKASFLDMINIYFHSKPEEKRSIIAIYKHGTIQNFTISK